MGCCALLTLALLLVVARCWDFPGVEVTQNVTAFLGEEMYLSCRYLGEESDLQSAEWKRQVNARGTSKRLAGFSNGIPFGRSGFSEPDSIGNLTVVTSVSGVEAEGEYKCQFALEEDDYAYSVFVTVVARPEILVQVNSETLGGVHYQSVVCSAVAGRPPAQIRWLVEGAFAVEVSEVHHPNGTSTVSSVLRFPTHLQDEDTVSCLVRHPTLQEDAVTAVTVETYKKPNVTITAEMVERGGGDFWVVSCISSGGRPETQIHLEPDDGEDVQNEAGSDSCTQTQTVVLPAADYHGQDVACVFQHPKFSHAERRVVTLPSFYLSAVRLWSSDSEASSSFLHAESVELQEGRGSDVVIGLQAVGRVPRYNVSCERDDGPLPDGVEVFERNIAVRAPVELWHGGLYECVASYYDIQAALKFNITVRPRVTLLVPPTIAVDLRAEDGRWLMECSAAGAVPAASVSWLLPQGVSSAASRFNSTARDGSRSVRGVVLLPACSPRELTALCVINHPALEAPQNRSVTIPMCAPPNITFHSASRWEDGEEYTEAHCSVESVAPAAAISWHVGETNVSSLTSVVVQEDVGDGWVLLRSSVRLLSSSHPGQDLTCTVQHPSLRAAEKRTARVPEPKARLLSVRVAREQNSLFWLAVCECNSGTDLTWLLPDSARAQTSMTSEFEGHALRSRLTYRFSLALHEGENLTCVHRNGRGTREERTVQVPRYYISAVRVVNQTTPLQSSHDRRQRLVARRLTLQENLRNQRVLLQVEGNVPECNLSCRRSDGRVVPMEKSAMVFDWEVRERDAGEYSCRASFYHHTATVSFLVEVTSEEKLLGMVAMVGISSGSAVLIVLFAVLWACRKGSRRRQYKEQEALAALTSLMQQPGSPEVKKPPAMTGDGDLSYAIVLDVKSSV